MTRLVFLDQNAWVTLARGSWDKTVFPREHAALAKIVEGVQSASIIVPLTFANVYETSKINDPVRRANIARAQALISGGRVFRGRRRILGETLAAHIASKLSIPRPEPEKYWFLSDLWFEAAADYSPETYGLELPPRVLDFIRRDPARALFDYLCFNDEEVRLEAVRRYSAGSAELLARIEARRSIASGETLAMRRRIYSARLIIDELDFILATGQQLGLGWRSVGDLGSPLTRSIAADVPILNAERELAVRLEDQSRDVDENDLRDMSSFITALPLADLVVAEKQFVNLARQAGLEEKFGTVLMTSILDF
ncbi:hypothetical protein NKH84_24070 [Mesorhizobium sp. M0902]|uniref:hypothetical protein n=1 Tax=unclassified Mesorhizobium TaxID=325217 RepID=UPI00333905DB